MLPFIAGERAPGWRGDRRASVTGLALDTGPLDVLAAALEAVALRLALVYDLLRPMAPSGHTIVASGGAIARSRAWARTIADALGQPLVLSREEEATSRGAALLALEALGRIPDVGAVTPPPGATIEPAGAHPAAYRAGPGRRRRP